MKLAIALTIALCSGFGFTSQALAGEKATCKVVTTDIGTIYGRGSSASDAFEDAVTQCFDRRSQKLELRKTASLDEETGLVLIDTCANITCGS